MARSLAHFYKRTAINDFLIGMYCSEGSKYKSKHNALIQRCIESSRKQAHKSNVTKID